MIRIPASQFGRRAMSTFPRTKRMQELLQSKCNALHLEVINESSKHNVPPGSETHFKIVVVSTQFDGMSRVKREQMIQGLLKPELDSGLHALSIVARSPSEWEKDTTIRATPNCKGGFGS